MDFLFLGDDLPSTLDLHVYKLLNYALGERYADMTIQPQSASMDDSGAITSDVITSNSEIQPDVIVEPLVTDDGLNNSSNLENFLARKTKILTQDWAVGAFFNTTLSPFRDFLEDPVIKKKLDNYRYVKGELVLTFYINGTPFHAGLLLASYRYMEHHPDVFTAGGDTQLISRTQRPHIFLNPTTNKSGVMKIPFGFPTNYLELSKVLPTINPDSRKIGRLNIDSFANLKMVNGGTDRVTVTVFAHLENAKLAGLTNFEAQAGKFKKKDEYEEKGPVSKVASAVANFSGAIALKFPGIAPFALASQIGANAVGGIASLFGYSRPVMIDNILPYKPSPISSLSLTDAVDSSQKLSATSKQELTVDPTISGYPEDDMLLITNFTERESYIDQFDWLPARLVDDTLWVVNVNPFFSRMTVSGSGFQVIPTSLSYASGIFEKWSGSLRYRFQVIGTAYHKGRLAIGYDPLQAALGDTYNTNYVTIVDLAETCDFTIEVPWQQAVAYKDVGPHRLDGSFSKIGGLSVLDTIEGSDNGQLYVKVLNELVTPDATTEVTIIVSISAGDNFELVNPTGELIKNFSFGDPAVQSGVFPFEIEPQAGELDVPNDENCSCRSQNPINIIPDYTSTDIRAKPLMYYGEKILSLRPLLKRYTHERSINTQSTGNWIRYYFLISSFALDRGYDINGIDAVEDVKNYNLVNVSFMSYLRNAFAGWRGSVRYKAVPVDSNIAGLSITRCSDSIHRLQPMTYENYAAYNMDSNDLKTINKLNQDTDFPAQSGVAITPCSTLNALEWEIPYASPFRFSPVRPYEPLENDEAHFLPFGDSSILSVYSGNSNSTKCALNIYVAAGDDYNLVGFIGAPVHWLFPTPDPA